MSGDSIHLSSPPSQVSVPSAAEGAPAPAPSKALLERLAFSAGMARVTKLGVYEEQFDAFAEGVAGIPKLLESGSESPVKKTDIIKRVGTLHSFRQKLNLEDENLLDEPEFLWEDADLHGALRERIPAGAGSEPESNAQTEPAARSMQDTTRPSAKPSSLRTVSRESHTQFCTQDKKRPRLTARHC